MDKIKRYNVKFNGNFGSDTFGEYLTVEGTMYCKSEDVEALEEERDNLLGLLHHAKGRIDLNVNIPGNLEFLSEINKALFKKESE